MNYVGNINEAGGLLLKTPNGEQSGCLNGKNVAYCSLFLAGAGSCSTPLLPYAASFLGFQLPNTVLAAYGVGIGCINCMGLSYLCCHSDDEKHKEKIQAVIKYGEQKEERVRENSKLRIDLQETKDKLSALEKEHAEIVAETESLRERGNQLNARFAKLFEQRELERKENAPLVQSQAQQPSYLGGMFSYFWSGN